MIVVLKGTLTVWLSVSQHMGVASTWQAWAIGRSWRKLTIMIESVILMLMARGCHLRDETGEQLEAPSPLQQDSFWLTPQDSAAWPTVVEGSGRGRAEGAAITAATKVAAMARNCILSDLVGWKKVL